MGILKAARKRTQFLVSAGLLSLTCLLSPLSKQACAAETGRENEFGLGIMLGEPTGISGRLNLSSKRSVDFGLARSDKSYFLILADYLFTFPHAFHTSSTFLSNVTPYVGVGGVLGIADQSFQFRTAFGGATGSTVFGVRIPLGIEWRPSSPPLGVFLEIAPGISILPSTQGFMQGDLGIRFYF